MLKLRMNQSSDSSIGTRMKQSRLLQPLFELLEQLDRKPMAFAIALSLIFRSH